MKLAPNFTEVTTKRMQAIEDGYYDAALKECKLAELRLKSETPKDTGATASAWSLAVTKVAGVMTVQFQHPNPDRVKMLNYGTKPHVIYPRNAQALKFEIGGVTVFAKYVFHPGTRAYGFMERTASRLQTELARINQTFKEKV